MLNKNGYIQELVNKITNLHLNCLKNKDSRARKMFDMFDKKIDNV